MSNLPWIKLYTEIINDDKLGFVDDQLKWRFVQLLALAGDCDAEGYLCSTSHPLSTKSIAYRLRLSCDQLQADLEVLAENDLIRFEAESGAWLIPSFARRQERPQADLRAHWRELKRQQRLRQAKKDAEESAVPLPEEEQLASGKEAKASIAEANQKALLLEQILADIRKDIVLDEKTFAEDNVLLKRRGEKNKEDKRKKEERRKPAPPSPPAVGSVLDQLAEELNQGKLTAELEERFEKTSPQSHGELRESLRKPGEKNLTAEPQRFKRSLR